jgi:4-hydroxyacetophenone monooxygenase
LEGALVVTKVDVAVRHELRAASDEVIADAVTYSNPMVLRGLLYQLTGDEELKTTPLKTVLTGYYSGWGIDGDDSVALVRRKAVEYLKKYRDAGAGPVTIGPMDRLQTSLGLVVGEPIPDDNMGLYTDDLGLNPWARSHVWQATPDSKRLADFSVTIVGAGMAGLNAALQLQRAGIPYVMIEKNHGVGGTWHENRYPGARVDTASRSYTHIFGADYNYPNPFCEQSENQKYFDWVADSFDVRKNIIFGTEVTSLTWDEKAAMWEIRMKGPDGEKVRRSRAVMTAVGFLSRPMIPDIEGKDEFQGPSWHTARWPVGTDLSNKRIVVIGTGCTGYQMIPELALQAKHVTVFQRTPQWIFPVPGYRSPFPPQIRWMDRNFPFHNNFMRFRSSWGAWFQKATEIDPNFGDPYTVNADNRNSRATCIAFLESKLKDPKLVAAMIPPHPPWSARPVAVDPEYSVLDAIQSDKVTLVTSGIKRINRTGVEDNDGHLQDAYLIVF